MLEDKKKDESPCIGCTRVRDPKSCENKTCKDWQAWFIARWEAMRRNVFAKMQQAEATGDAISVGGFQYSHPDRVRSNMENKPCDKCVCPAELCSTPCAVLRAWTEQNAMEVSNELEI